VIAQAMGHVADRNHHPQAEERSAALEALAPPAESAALLTGAEWAALKRICTEK
jgi:hypothetical protein